MKNRLSNETMTIAVETCELPNVQYHRNHDDCPAGQDIRKRLSIRLSEDKRLVLAHCFNCGLSGVRTSRIPSLYKAEPSKEVVNNYLVFDSTMARYKSGTPITPDGSWPSVYFLDCWSELQDADKFGIKETSDSYYIPRGNPPEDITGFEIRLKGDRKLYKRIIHPNYKYDSKLLLYNGKGSRNAVICEDPISAMKISLAGYAGVSLCGSSMSSDDAFKVTMLFDSVTVWLDNDKPEIIRASLLIRDRLRLYMNKVTRIQGLKDPKYFTLQAIDGYIKEAETRWIT